MILDFESLGLEEYCSCSYYCHGVQSATSSLASPPTQLESFLLCLNDCSQDELENSLEVCKWVLEVLDSDTNGIVRLDAWADLCVSLAKASKV